MNTLSPEMTVGEIAAQIPASTRVFEKYGIDFCCGGGVALGEACRRHGADPAGILGEIATAAPLNGEDADWRNSSLAALIDHIVGRHHTYLRTHLPRLEALLEKVVAAHAARHPAVLGPLASIFLAMKAELEQHLDKEETILFPIIRRLEDGDTSAGRHCGSVQNPIRVMFLEHDSAGDALARMRGLTLDYAAPEGACNTFRALYFELAELERDLHRHIHLENNILFPRTMTLAGLD